MTRALLLLALGGCLNVPAFNGGGGDGGAGSDASGDGIAPLGPAIVTVFTRDGTHHPIAGAIVVTEPYGGAEDTAAMTQTGPDGVAQIMASGTTRVYIADLQDVTPVLVVFEDVAAGDALVVGAPRRLQTPTFMPAGTAPSNLFPSASFLSTHLACGYVRQPYTTIDGVTVSADDGCTDNPSPMLFYYEDSSNNAVGAQTGEWGPGASAFAFHDDAAAIEPFWVSTSQQVLDIANMPAYAWAFGDGKRLAEREFNLPAGTSFGVPWRGYDDLIELSEYLATTGRFGMVVRDRVQASTADPVTMIPMAPSDLAPWIAKPLLPGSNAMSWTLADGRDGTGATQMVVIDVYNQGASNAVRWIAPGRRIAANGTTETLAMPIPADLFPNFSFDASTPGQAAVRLVHAVRGNATDEATIYDILRQTADVDAMYAEFTNAPGITRASVSGVQGDSDATRYLP